MLLVYFTLSGRNPYSGTRGHTDATCHLWLYVHPVYKLEYILPYQHRSVTSTGSPSGSSRLPTPVGTRSPTTSNRVQWMIDAIQPRMETWVEEFLTTKLPSVARVCLDRTVPALVDEHMCSAIPPLLEEILPTLVQREVVTALATVDDESPSGTARKGAFSSAVADHLATTIPAEAGVDARAARLDRSEFYANAR